MGRGKDLIRCFQDQDPNNTGYVNKESFKQAMIRFGITNIKDHEIKTLIKLEDSDNLAESDIESEDEQNYSGNLK